MKNIFLKLLVISLVLSFSMGQINDTEIECEPKCPLYHQCNKSIGECVHKGFFPIYPLELMQIVIAATVSTLATSCGIGGGSIYSVMLMAVEGFIPSQAYPVSNFIILICAIATFYVGYKDKKRNPQNGFVDYDFSLIFCPILLLGTKFGAILNRLLSSLVLSFGLIVLVTMSTMKTYQNAIRERKKEDAIASQAQSLVNREYNLIQEVGKHNQEEATIDNSFRLDRVQYLCLFVLLVIIDQLLEGNNRLNSIIGVTRCSSVFWLIFFAHVALSIFLVIFFLKKITHDRKVSSSYDEEENEKFTYIQNNLIMVMLLTFCGGIISGMLGVGGGMITTPLLIAMGLNAKSSTSTSNFLIIFSAISGTCIFLFSGQLLTEMAIWLAIPCGLAALFGSQALIDHINKTKRASIILFILCYFLVASWIIAVYGLVEKFIHLKAFDASLIVSGNKFC